MCIISMDIGRRPNIFEFFIRRGVNISNKNIKVVRFILVNNIKKFS